MDNKRIDDTFLKVYFDENGRSKRRTVEKSIELQEEQINIEDVQEKKYTKKQLIAAVVAAVVISTSLSSVATNRIDNFIEQQEQVDNLNEALGNYKMTFENILHNAALTRKIYNGNIYQDSNEIVEYDPEAIASSINDKFETQKEKDIAIYTLYKFYDRSAGGDNEAITSKTVRYLTADDGKYYSGLHDYVAKKGFNNINDYDQKMQDIIIDEYNYNKSLESVGGKQWK